MKKKGLGLGRRHLRVSSYTEDWASTSGFEEWMSTEWRSELRVLMQGKQMYEKKEE